MLTGLGYEASQFSVHSHRAGGATDLFTVGLTLAEVMKHGRWETDTTLIYYPDKNRLVFKVAYAFGTCKCMASGGQFPSPLTLEDLRIVTSWRA
jgi:hypothetical protein